MNVVSGYKSKIQNEEIDFLYDAILKLQTREECYRFFDDICTINEIQSLSQRMQVAKMLKDRKTYQDISITTGASTATISRVNRCLNYGSDGYEVVLSRLEEDNKK
nr:YerC/YecD family TrpR-related protein [Clostridium mobile]